jgi:hypothetical protein
MVQYPWDPGDSPGNSSTQGGGGGGGSAPPPATGACPAGQEMINGKCRYPGDFPCPPGQCKDVVSGICRNPGKNEKVKESDGSDVRGNCRQLDPGKNPNAGGGGGGGGGAAAGPKAPGSPGGIPTGPGAACPPGWDARTCALLGIGTGANQPGGAMEKSLMEILGGQTRYSPAVMQDLFAGSKLQTEGQVQNASRQANEDAASRGMFNSGMAQQAQQDIRAEGDQRFSQDARQFRIEKVNADFEDKLAGIDRAQKWLDSLRSHASQLDQTLADREKTEAAMRLAYAQLAQQKELFLKQLASNKELLGMQLNSAEFLAGLRLSMGL